MEKWPGSQEANQVGCSIGHAASKPIYEVLGEDPVRVKRMADGMTFQHSGKGGEGYLFREYDWSGIKEDAIIVDVGGSHGSAVVEIT